MSDDNVISLDSRREPPLDGADYWECNCGSIAFYYIRDHELVCMMCKTVQVGAFPDERIEPA